MTKRPYDSGVRFFLCVTYFVAYWRRGRVVAGDAVDVYLILSRIGTETVSKRVRFWRVSSFVVEWERCRVIAGDAFDVYLILPRSDEEAVRSRGRFWVWP